MTINPANVDYTETGTGPLIVLVHSSASNARQWRQLMDDLNGRYHLIAINLFGYGTTPPWSGPNHQTLKNHADLVESIIPKQNKNICIVGHSFGGSVAMKTAAQLPDRVDRLILLDPNPFPLLKERGRTAAFNEILALRNYVKECGDNGDWASAGKRFADYWGSPGTWETMSEKRRANFISSIPPNYFEWDAVMNEETTLAKWYACLPRRTLVVTAQNTPRPTRELYELMQQTCEDWYFEDVPCGGHMAPVTHPGLVNPIIEKFAVKS